MCFHDFTEYETRLNAFLTKTVASALIHLFISRVGGTGVA